MNIDSLVIILEKIMSIVLGIVGWCADHIFLVLAIILVCLIARQFFKHKRKIQKQKSKGGEEKNEK